MTYLTFDELEKYALEKSKGYWREGYKYRWKYMQYVIEHLKRMNPEKIIEAGCMDMPLCKESICIDLPDHDLNIVPYKYGQEIIPDKSIDVFVALQVWEHLDKQTAAFQEVRRISKYAILSFPYKWKHGDKRHKGIDEKKISKWTCNIKPYATRIIKERIVYCWKF